MNTSTPKGSTSPTQKETLKAKQMLAEMIAKWEEENLVDEMEDLWNKGLKTRERELVEGLRGLDGLAGEAKGKECIAPLFIPAVHGSSSRNTGLIAERQGRGGGMISYAAAAATAITTSTTAAVDSVLSPTSPKHSLNAKSSEDLPGTIPTDETDSAIMVPFSPVSPVSHQPILVPNIPLRSQIEDSSSSSTPSPWLVPNLNDPAWRDISPSSLNCKPPLIRPSLSPPPQPHPSVTSPNYSPHNRVSNPRFPSSSIPDLFPFPALTPFNPR